MIILTCKSNQILLFIVNDETWMTFGSASSSTPNTFEMIKSLKIEMIKFYSNFY